MSQPINTRWFHVTVDANWSGVVTMTLAKHKEARPNNSCGINMKDDGTEALIKVTGAANWKPVPAAIIRTFTADDHHEAISMVRAPEWEPAT